MTVAPITARRLWYNWIPKSWYANGQEGGIGDPRNDHRVYRDRDRDRDIDLDDTRSFRRRYDDIPPSSPRVQVPFGVIITIVIYLIGQLVGGVWWAATLQSNLQHEIADRSKEEIKLWTEINTYRAEVNALRIDIARVTGTARRPSNISREEE